MAQWDNRRAFLTIAGAGALLAACRTEEKTDPETLSPPAGMQLEATTKDKPKAPESDANEVGSVEDLMREHGVIRRVLIVYRESAVRLRTSPASVPLDALKKAAMLLRAFGEVYHEQQLEEPFIFPAVKKAGGLAAEQIDTLIAQHQRGRAITSYILAVTETVVSKAGKASLAAALEAFARMYEAHAAHEDTVVFPAWKKALSAKQLDEMGDRFEEIEHQTFGKDGFESAVEQIAAIEKTFGIELASMTAPVPESTLSGAVVH